MYNILDRIVTTVFVLYATTIVVDLIFNVELINRKHPITLSVIAVTLVMFIILEIKKYLDKRKQKSNKRNF